MQVLAGKSETTEMQVRRSEVAVIVPTYNSERDWPAFSAGLRMQKLDPSQVLIVDSSSKDRTVELAAAEGFRTLVIPQSEFNHGGTRQLGLRYFPEARIAVYLTQDAVLRDENAIDRLVQVFSNPEVGAAYGRQLPRKGAGPLEAHARLFNYPAESHLRDINSRETMGVKVVFFSNSFSAYRIEALQQVGGFPTDVIMAEDVFATARLLENGWKIAYVAEAAAYHSHGYTTMQEFRRYFDTGVYHARSPWLLKQFGRPTGEGKKFVLSELKSLWPNHAHLVPLAIVRTFAKAAGYALGRREGKLPLSLRRRLSMHKGYWTDRRISE